MTEKARTQDALVSVIIPTIGRPELRSTVESALAQTAHLLEVIVAADTADDLDLPDDPRVKLVRTGPRAGGNVARMTGVRLASGALVALLDDDDLWVPSKLERQVAAVRSALGSLNGTWLCTSLVEETSGRYWPKRMITPGERLPDYLFRKQAVVGGQGAIHTSTMLFPRQLVLEHGFDESLRFHQDTDWLLRLDREVPSLQVVQIREALTQLRESTGSVSRGIKPRESLAWAKSAMARVDRHTRADFLVTVTYFQAIRHRDPAAAAQILREAFLWGPPSLTTLPAVVLLPAKAALKGWWRPRR